MHYELPWLAGYRLHETQEPVSSLGLFGLPSGLHFPLLPFHPHVAVFTKAPMRLSWANNSINRSLICRMLLTGCRSGAGDALRQERLAAPTWRCPGGTALLVML